MMSPPLLFLLLLVSSRAFSPLPSSLTGKSVSAVVCTRQHRPSLSQRRPTTMTKPFLEHFALGSKEADGGGAESSRRTMEITSSSSGEEDDEVCVVAEEELSDTKKLLKQVKDAGTAGVISYA